MKTILIIFITIITLFSCSDPQKKTEQNQQEIAISSENRQALTVFLTKNNLNQPVIAWTEEDAALKQKYFFYAIYNNSEKLFSDKIEIPLEQNTNLHLEGMPKVAFRKNGEVFAFYEVKTNPETNRFASEIHYRSSKDNGKNWSDPLRVHKGGTKGKGWSFLDVTTLSNGEIGACWLDTSYIKGGRAVKFAQTNSEGRFVNEIIVDSLACQCCRTGIYCGKEGKISIVYRDIINDSIRDISVAISNDLGESFSKPVCFSGDNWNIDGCPHNGPDIVSDDENIYAVWFTGASEKGVYYSELTNHGAIAKKQRVSADGRYIQITTLPNGDRVLVYNQNTQKQEKYYSHIEALIQPTGKKILITPEESQSSTPTVIATGDKTFLASWIKLEDIESDSTKNKKNAKGGQVFYKTIFLE